MSRLGQVVLAVVLLLSGAAAQDYPFNNMSLPWDQRVADLVSRLTLPVRASPCEIDRHPVSSAAPTLRRRSWHSCRVAVPAATRPRRPSRGWGST